MTAQKKKFWTISGIIYATLLLLLVLIVNLSAVNEWLGKLLWLLRPVTIGLIIAYLLNPFFRLFEKKIFKADYIFIISGTHNLLFCFLCITIFF